MHNQAKVSMFQCNSLFFSKLKLKFIILTFDFLPSEPGTVVLFTGLGDFAALSTCRF